MADLLERRWQLSIIYAALSGALRFSEFAEAVAHVERAIAINPENRALAKTDPDLDPVRDDEAFRAALEAPAILRPERRRPVRPRSAR